MKLQEFPNLQTPCAAYLHGIRFVEGMVEDIVRVEMGACRRTARDCVGRSLETAIGSTK